MKSLFVSIFLFIYTCSFSQYNRGKIQLNDGTELIGLIKITKDDGVKFKIDDDSAEKKYNNDLIKSFEFNENNILRKFIYSETIHIDNKKSRSDKWNKLLEILIDGKIKLYMYYTIVYNNTGQTSYYIKKENDNLPVFYYGEGYLYKQKFIPFVEKYFSDCTTLIDKVKSKELKHSEFKEVVQYYNQSCL